LSPVPCPSSLLPFSFSLDSTGSLACSGSQLSLELAAFTVKDIKVRIHKIIILSVVLYGCETWSLRVREVHKLRVLENMVFRRIFGPKKDGVLEGEENCITRSFIICTLRQV
jgi:hypothetical protein